MTRELDEIDLEKLRGRRRRGPINSGRSGMGTSLSCVGMLWSMLSFAAMGLSCVGYYMPFWLQGSSRMNHTTMTSYLSTFRRCNYPTMTTDGQVVIVKECGRYTTFADIPSVWWQVATISIGVGCALTILVAFTALISCCLDDVLSRNSAKVAGVLQFIAGISIGAGCLLYPLGWECREVQQVCGPHAHIYHLGQCTISWGYYCTIAGGGTALLSALLSCNSSKVKPDYYNS